MTDKEKKANNSYVRIYRNIIEDSDISIAALGLFVIMISRAGEGDSLEDFRRFTDNDVNTMECALRELTDNGYACVEPEPEEQSRNCWEICRRLHGE